MQLRISKLDLAVSKFIVENIKVKHLILINKIVNPTMYLVSFYLFLKYVLFSLNLVDFFYFIYTSLSYILIERLFKRFFRRPRPFYFFKLEELKVEYFGLGRKNRNKNLDSFPSSHTLYSVMIFLYFFINRGEYISILLLLIPIFRVFGQKHWISDILFSIFLSLIFYFLFSLIIL